MARYVLCIGAHPDDNEAHVGGTAAKCRARGDVVKFVAVTNGNKGHFAEEYKRSPALLAARRMREAQTAAAVIGAEFETLNVPDGEVYVTPKLTTALVRLIRTFGPPGQGPDLVLFHRPMDYHRDHRYTAQLVLDAAFLLTVPLLCSEVPPLKQMPVLAYWWDGFTEGGAFRPDVVVPIDDVLEQKIEMLCAHESQMFEWLPYLGGKLEEVPSDPAGRRTLVTRAVQARNARVREDVEEQLCRQGLAAACQYAEAFQISEYGRQPEEEELRTLFPAFL